MYRLWWKVSKGCCWIRIIPLSSAKRSVSRVQRGSFSQPASTVEHQDWWGGCNAIDKLKEKKQFSSFIRIRLVLCLASQAQIRVSFHCLWASRLEQLWPAFRLPLHPQQREADRDQRTVGMAVEVVAAMVVAVIVAHMHSHHNRPSARTQIHPVQQHSVVVVQAPIEKHRRTGVEHYRVADSNIAVVVGLVAVVGNGCIPAAVGAGAAASHFCAQRDHTHACCPRTMQTAAYGVVVLEQM